MQEVVPLLPNVVYGDLGHCSPLGSNAILSKMKNRLVISCQN